MSPTRAVSPGKRSFFKYVSPEAVIAILDNRTVRYSSPLLFNDPFDIQSGLHFDFDLALLRGKVIDRIAQLASTQTLPDIDKNDPWGKLILLAHQRYPTHGFPRDAWERMPKEPFNLLLDEIKKTQKGYQEHWHNLLPSIRVFSVSEERDNLLMWAHYTKDHSGAVLELLSLPEEDNPLSVAQPIKYVESPPALFSEAEWIDSILFMKKFDISALSKKYTSCKSSHWSYEKEWRVWYPAETSPVRALYEYMPVRQSEFSSLYIGCNASGLFVRDAITLCRKNFPDVKIYQAKKSNHSYLLEYFEI